MRISDQRYDRDTRKMALAARMLTLGGRTRTVERWTTLPMTRIRALYHSYDLIGSHRSMPLQGTTPKSVAHLFKSLVVRCEAALLAGFFRHFEVLPARFGEAAVQRLPELSRGERMCEALDKFRAVCPQSELTLEHAMMLLNEWVRGVEIEVVACPECGCLMIRDLLARRQINCAYCSYEKHWGVAQFKAKGKRAAGRKAEADDEPQAAAFEHKTNGTQTRLL